MGDDQNWKSWVPGSQRSERRKPNVFQLDSPSSFSRCINIRLCWWVVGINCTVICLLFPHKILILCDSPFPCWHRLLARGKCRQSCVTRSKVEAYPSQIPSTLHSPPPTSRGRYCSDKNVIPHQLPTTCKHCQLAVLIVIKNLAQIKIFGNVIYDEIYYKIFVNR